MVVMVMVAVITTDILVRRSGNPLPATATASGMAAFWVGQHGAGGYD